MEISNLSNIVLQVFSRTLSFLQHVGVLQAYSFSHSNVFYSADAEKYLETFISLLSEIQDVLSKLQELQKQKKSVEVVVVNSNPSLVSGDMIEATHYLSNAEIFATEQMIVPTTELSSFIGSTVIEEYQVPEIVIETANEKTSWISAQEKNTTQNEENVEEPPPAPPPLPPPVVPPKPRKSRFECSVCDKVLSSNASYKFHMGTHTGKKSYCCEHCGKLFSTNMILAAHLTRQHNLNTESAHPCQECGKLFVRKSALDMHMKGHMGLKPWTCVHCNKAFTQKVTRDTHQLTHTRDYKYRCDECGKTYPTKAKLNFHLKTHGEPQYSCNVCEKMFSTRQYLKAHYRTHDLGGSETAHCRLDTVSTQQMVVPNPYNCSHCDRSFPSQHTLQIHSQRHNPLSSRYRYLEKRKMAPRQKHTCEVCGKEFLHRSSLIHHNRQRHSTELTEQQKRPFSCNLCLKRFTMRSKAALHLLTHSEAEHSCEVCGRMFRRKDALRRHVAVVHNKLANLTCNVCQHISTTTPAHKEHMKTHAMHFTCAQCNKVFKSKVALSFHTKHIHEGSFKYHCNICGKQFVRKCHYLGHLQTHSTERLFKCDVCGKGFKDKKVCTEHTKRVHTGPLHPGNPLANREVPSTNLAPSDLNIESLLAGDNATYGHTYDQFQASVQLQ